MYICTYMHAVLAKENHSIGCREMLFLRLDVHVLEELDQDEHNISKEDGNPDKMYRGIVKVMYGL